MVYFIANYQLYNNLRQKYVPNVSEALRISARFNFIHSLRRAEA